jgi:general secretion pathway protein N
MTGGEMIRCGSVLGLTACFMAFGDPRISALGATDPVAVAPPENTISRGIVNAGPESIGPANPVARERPPTGNPLWAVPLRTLSVTRERPIFSPSRRPPPPAVIAAPYIPPAAPPPPKPAEPDHPLLTLVGTVVGETEGIGVFFDQSAKSVIRLRTGQDHTGWILRSVQGREAMFEKDRQTATLALPPHGAEQAGQLPILPSGGTQADATWVDGDGQMIRPPSRRSPQSIAPPPLTAAEVEADVRIDSTEPPDRGR